MKPLVAALLLPFVLAVSGFAAGKGPEINLVDNKLSIDVQTVSLGRLLRLLDLATGMQSKVPAELAERNISVKFSGLSVEDGVRKIFQGQPFDYVIVERQGVIITSASQTTAVAESAPIYNAPQQQTPFAPQPIEQPFTQDFPPIPMPQPGQPLPPQQQPAMIQTPFGPIANPRAAQPLPQMVPQPAPAQQNPLFPDQRINPPGTGGVAPAPAPFGTPSPFGAPQNNPSNPNGLFGAPTVFSAPGATQSRP
jgi:hypothetical protein